MIIDVLRSRRGTLRGDLREQAAWTPTGRSPNPLTNPLYFVNAFARTTTDRRVPSIAGALPLSSVSYKGFAITPRTFQIRGSGRWTLDLLIGRRKTVRSFSGPTTFATEEAAIRGCRAFGQRIIDGRVPNYSVEDLL